MPGLVPEGRSDSDARGLPCSLLPQGLTDKKDPPKTELSYRRKFLTIKIHKIVCRNSVLSVNKHQSQQRVKNTVSNITKDKLGLMITTDEIINQPERT